MVIPLINFPIFSPYSRITPFTYKDGLTYLEVLEGLRTWLRDELVPHLNAENEGFEEEVKEQINTLITTVNALITQLNETDNASELALEEIQAIVAGLPDFAAIIAQVNAILDAIDSLGVGQANGLATLDSNGDVPETQIPSRLSQTSLDARYQTKPLDSAVNSVINSASTTRESLDNIYLQKRDYERPIQLQGQSYLAFADSYGTTVGGVPSYLSILETDFSLALTNRSVGSRYFQDGAMAGWGSSQTIPAGKSPKSFGHIAFGINPMLQQRGLDPITRRAEMDALEALVWMMCAESFTSNDIWAKTGTWATYSNGAMKNSSSYVADAAGAYGVATPPAGDYVGMGFSYTEAAPASVLAGTGIWKKGAATVQANNNEKAAVSIATNLVFTPRPIRLMGLNGTDVIRVDSVANQFTFLDEMIKLGEPPFIVIVKPVYVNNAFAPNTTVDIWRADIDARIASVIAAYPKLKGKVINVDPVLNGWDSSKHLQSDGVHPNALGAAMIEECTRRAIYRTAKARELAVTLGI